MRRGQRRPAGERHRVVPRFATPARTQPERATIALAASTRLSLASVDLDVLRALWAQRGGSTREFSDGTVEVLHPNGERALRGTPERITTQLRARLAS